MPLKSDSASFIKMRTIFFFSLIILLGVSILYVFRPFFYPLFWAAVIAIMFRPIYNFINKYLKHQNLSSAISLLMVVIILFLPLVLLSTLLINESVSLYQKVNNSELVTKVGEVNDWLNQNKLLAPYLKGVQTNWLQYADNAAKIVSTFLVNNLTNITQNSLWFLSKLFIMFYILFFFFRDGDLILKRLMHLSPLGDKYEGMLCQRFTSTARATLKGTVVIGSIQGILGGLLFWATGIQGALVWGVIMIITAIVPVLGCSIIWFPAGIIMLATGNIWQGLTILVFGLLVISVIDNLLRPIIVGRDIAMHPVIVLLASFGGLILFGASGFVIGPVIAALFLAVISIYNDHYSNELGKN